nr:SAM-dependent methyltransferase [Anaerolineae bacterium]
MTELKTSHLSEIYNNRFTKQTRDARLRLWAILCQNWIQAYIPKESTVLDLAAGQCEFINQIQARRKIAVDLNQDIYQFAAPGVQVII